MRAAPGLLLALAVGCRSVPAPAGSPVAPAPSATWQLVWSDEFDGPRGAPVDETRWVYEEGGHGWGNEELQYYTSRMENASLTGDGRLAIRAVRERYEGRGGPAREYTSARLKTQGRFEQTHGRFEARIRVPRGQGLWPAFWMLGADIPAVGWPDCGEIDIMENIGREPDIVWGSLHGPGFSGGEALNAFHTSSGGALADDFHVFAVEWEERAIRWSMDGVVYQTRTPADLPAGGSWVFEHPFFLLLNVAVGGRWPGHPDATTSFPQAMLVDYVRVYRRGAAPSAAPASRRSS